MTTLKPGSCNYSILLVENEPGIRSVFKKILLVLGYSVYTAQNGQEGLKVLKSKKIDLVITDIQMPVMNGEEFLNEIHLHYPQIKTIVASGSTFTPKNLPADIILQKPLGMNELSLAVHSCQN